jgi:hypothetical protein
LMYELPLWGAHKINLWLMNTGQLYRYTFFLCV